MNFPKVDLPLVQQTYTRIAPFIVKTPLNHSQTLSELLDKSIYFKLENLQFTSSFKERGVVSRLSSLTDEEKQRGVITMSAGNHAQALACHAKRLGIKTTIVMPRTTPIAKIAKTRFFNPEIVLAGSSFEETFEEVEQRRESANLTLIHPFDDPHVVAGQGSAGLEILEQLPEVDTVIVPVGGGGLIAGIAIVLKTLKPSVRIVGVQSEHYCPAYARFKKVPWAPNKTQISIAEGIAVKRPGNFTMPILEELLDDMVLVSESAIETAMYRFLDIEKTVVEGAGAASLAAVSSQPDVAQGKTVCLVSGGNVDPSVVSDVIQRSLVRTNRIVRLHSTVQDIPGSLAKLANDISNTDSNILDIYHRRNFGHSTLDATVVEVTVQLRGEDDKEGLIEKLRLAGHEVTDADAKLNSDDTNLIP